MLVSDQDHVVGCKEGYHCVIGRGKNQKGTWVPLGKAADKRRARPHDARRELATLGVRHLLLRLKLKQPSGCQRSKGSWTRFGRLGPFRLLITFAARSNFAFERT